MKSNLRINPLLFLILSLVACGTAFGQLTPSQDSYINTADPTTNYGAQKLLDVESSQTTYIQFDLSAIPSGYTGANITKASLKLYVNAVTKAGSLNVDYVNGSWSESTITANTAPALGTTIAASVPLTTADKNQYIVVDITPAVQAWLNGTANDGIALVGNSPVNATFDSKESTTTSHSAELDIVFAGGGGSGITGIDTASGSGLIGGGTSGTLNLSLTNTCATNQVLQWNGSAWICASVGTGTITGVTAGTDLTGGGTSGNVTLNLNTANVPQLNTANTFTGNQTVKGNLTATGAISAGTSFNIGGSQFVYGSAASQSAFFGLAGNFTMTGLGNTATGFLALSSNTNPTGNTAYGAYALSFNTSGTGNSAIGYQSLESNTTGNYNTANGYQTLAINSTGYYNTASGWQSLFYNTTGTYNTATGGSALYVNTTGYFNTGTGGFALAANTTGNSNTGDGMEALAANTTGSSNTASGASAIWSNTTGSQNTAAGFQSLFLNITASGNTADGYEALLNSTSCCNVAVGDLALQYVSTGQANTGVGNHAGATADSSYVTGSNNTTLGTGTKLGTGTLTNATALGANAEVDASNSLVLGSINGVNGQTATVKVGIGTTTPSNVFTIASGAGKAIADGWSTYSSRRWKTNIQTLQGALAKVEQLRGVSYDLKANGKHEVGVIAEEVGAVVPEIVTWENNGKDARGVEYERLTALLIEATKEQQRQFEQQQAELAKALHQIKQQQSLLRAQSSSIKSLKAGVREARETVRQVKAELAHAEATMVATK
ncbi:MAG: DNRLRE domain-containing protein [Terriglobales bacterium]